MLIFMLNSQLLSVPGDSKTLTRAHVTLKTREMAASGGLGEGVEDGRTFSVCGFLCYRIALYIFMVEKGKHKEIHMQMQSHLFMYS